MEFSDVVRSRRMIRNYDPERPVPDEVLARVLGNAVRAPSAGFSQGWDFVVLRTEAERGAFWEATTDPAREADNWLRGIQHAPCLIVCCSSPAAYLDRYAEPDKGWTDRDAARWPVPYWDVDTGMAALLMLLTAVDEELGGLFFGVPVEQLDAAREALSIPSDRNLVGVVSLGYRAPDKKSPSLKRGRRKVSQVAHAGTFGEPLELG
ncbi:nitroreductase family protein [Ornithinimicrobium faecis]|uniref:Nitroreductase family protein n=1 Tax=Ornithinimicrobium faecis TaxID=2934158 RepID=A0ABY4Z051_9MICO|nr:MULTISPECIES: nitroreductase family protein [unclassified Ornithinimicrobium]USQ81747.1 nitroreductase family protein [Ornithinimicrobium sp. HY1793]